MKLNELKSGLKNITRGIDESLKSKEREWKKLPWHVQVQFVEEAKDELREANAELGETGRKLQEKNKKLDQEKQKNSKYKAGPTKRSENSAQHIAAICKLMSEKIAQQPSMSEAKARQLANKTYGKCMGRNGPYYQDENYLRRKLKEYKKTMS